MKVPLVIDGQEAPKPEGGKVCDFCDPPRYFENWDLLAGHVTIVHNENGRKRSFYNGKAPDEILNHEDWTGYDD